MSFPEIAEQALEGRLVPGLVGEVADVALLPDEVRPGSLHLYNRIVYSDGEKDRLSAFHLPAVAPVDFVFDPAAVNGRFREDEQELFVGAYGLVDLRAEFVSNLEVFWGEPAADAGGLEIVV